MSLIINSPLKRLNCAKWLIFNDILITCIYQTKNYEEKEHY